MASDQEASILREAIDFGCIQTVVDSFAGQYSIGTQLVGSGYDLAPAISVITNDHSPAMTTDHHDDALEQRFYNQISLSHGIDAIVISPPAGVLDVALPLAERNADLVVCCQVPMPYITEAHEHRARWFRSLQNEERLFFIITDTIGSTKGYYRVWVIIFKTKAIGEWLRKPYAGYKILLEEPSASGNT